MATRLDELWQDYQDTLPRLAATQEEHTAAYTESQDKYKRWIAAGGDHKKEEGYGKP